MDQTAVSTSNGAKQRPHLLRRIKLEQWLIVLVLIPLTALFSAELLLSLNWRMVHDTPNLHYMAWLIDTQNLAPYKDLFETNLPGVYLFHLAMGKTVGYGDFAFRIIDIGWLLALLYVVWRLMRRFGGLVGWAAAILFGLSYLQQGPDLGLQRDYIGLLPIIGAVAIMTSERWEKRRGTLLIVGLLFGLAACIKPHLLIGLPLLLLYGLVSDQAGRPFSWLRAFGWGIKAAVISAVGVAIPLILSLLWVWQQGAWPYFVDLFQNYLPLYLQLGKDHSIITGTARIGYLAKWWRTLGGLTPWLISSVLGVFIATAAAQLSGRLTRTAALLAGLTVAYSLYPVFSGQFFTYLWIPLHFFLILTSALTLTALPTTHLWQRLFGPAVLLGVLALMLYPAPYFFVQLRGGEPAPPKNGQVDRIADALIAAGYETGDRVQPLDWTGGTNHALLMLEAPVATRYVYDYYFQHHIDEAYIQGMRRHFLTLLETDPPAFVVANDVDTRVRGPNTSEEFAELDAFLTARYTIASDAEGIVVYRLK